jgi:hypothetical protein
LSTNPPNSQEKGSLASQVGSKVLLRGPAIVLSMNHQFVYNA